MDISKIRSFGIKANFSPVQKICLTGVLIALVTILQKVIAINYIAVIPFVRISFGGCALIMLSSIMLGPWYGLVVGACSDLLGYFIFDPKTMGFFPQITAIYALLGFSSYFVFMLIRKIKNNKILLTIEYSTFALFFIGVTLFIVLNNEITLYSSTYHIELWQKITIPCILFVLFALMILCIIMTDKYMKKKNDNRIIFSCNQISFSSFIIEVFVMIIFGSLMKGCAFGFQTYLVILIAQIIVGFINVTINTFLISYLLILLRRFYNVQK